jgi:Methyltransferase domain
LKNRRQAAVESPISHLVSNSKRESFETFKKHMEQSMLFREKDRNRQFAVDRAIENRQTDELFVEFGVAGGQGCNLFGKALAPHGLSLTGFDSFEGLEEDWTGIQSGRQVGAFHQQGTLPAVPDNVTLVKGWVQDTLPGFMADAGDANFRFIHMDMDTYTPTLFALKAVKQKLVPGTVILFDELYGYPGWRHHEYKALQEVLSARSYKYISFSAESVAIEMV